MIDAVSFLLAPSGLCHACCTSPGPAYPYPTRTPRSFLIPCHPRPRLRLRLRLRSRIRIPRPHPDLRRARRTGHPAVTCVSARRPALGARLRRGSRPHTRLPPLLPLPRLIPRLPRPHRLRRSLTRPSRVRVRSRAHDHDRDPRPHPPHFRPRGLTDRAPRLRPRGGALRISPHPGTAGAPRSSRRPCPAARTPTGSGPRRARGGL
ncbi:hypothetical protein C8Q73DRAFT_389796 [Cubamyces lactineus]|nr:hypothetical protein C8Q73DRAFT_389796 [Cubamyces lactineus]